MSSSTKTDSSVVRRGTWPILRYEVRANGWRSTIFIDDEEGNLVIEFDSRKFFGHWWGGSGRGDKTLRDFLVRASQGYIEDKLSYDLPRWDSQKAINALYQLCEKKWGHIDEWPIETAETMESLHEVTQDEFYAILNYTEHFNEVYNPGEHSFGEIGANIHVLRFTEKIWPTIVEFWRKEREAEAVFDV